MSDPTLAYAMLMILGRLTPAEAEAGAALWESDDALSSPREVARLLIQYAALGTKRMRVFCPRCDGRGFYRGYKLKENEAITVFCDDCDGFGTTLVDLDL